MAAARMTLTRRLTTWLDAVWYGAGHGAGLLRPLAGLYGMAVQLRRWGYGRGIIKKHRMPVPVIVVGNITVGGTGKTPLVAHLAHRLMNAGWRPGIVSRGYGTANVGAPRMVHADSDPRQVGDEPVLLARRTGCPVTVAANRVAAAHMLLAGTECDIIISDDGLQHYSLERDLEIAVLDDWRSTGNGRLLPAGPLREPERRLEEVDWVVRHGSANHVASFSLTGDTLRSLADDSRTVPLSRFTGERVHAVAAIGNPERFFRRLERDGLIVIRHRFPDHHAFTPADFSYADEIPIIMTEKDAVKCMQFEFGGRPVWYLPVAVEANPLFEDALHRHLQRLRSMRAEEGVNGRS